MESFFAVIWGMKRHHILNHVAAVQNL